jgi:hypothetical protein
MRKIVMVAFVMALVVVLAAVLARNGEAAGDAMKWPSEVVGWKWDGKQEAYDAQSIFKYIDGAAEVYLAYNFQGLNVGRYDRDGRPELVADVYRMGTAEDAFGAFSFERQDDDAAIGQGSEFGGGLLRFWKGSYFVTVYADGEAPDAERAVLELGKAIAASIGETGSPPDIARALPGKEAGLVERSVRFVRSHVLLNQRFFVSHDNILGLDRKVGAALATYVRGDRQVTLLLIRYPDEAKAAAALTAFRNAYMPEAATTGTIRTEDATWTSSEREGTLLVVVFGAPAEADARALLKSALQKSKGRKL